ncbi:MAG: hypothetical protein ACYC2T_09335 [Bacillota bacterium]
MDWDQGTDALVNELMQKLIELGYHEFQVREMFQEAKRQAETDSAEADSIDRDYPQQVIGYLRDQVEFAQKCYRVSIRYNQPQRVLKPASPK